VRKEYHPPVANNIAEAEKLIPQIQGRPLTADELLSWYCTLTFAQTGSYAETARRLKLDRRTVQRKINDKWPGIGAGQNQQM
jgi:ActR/RegA family two-component response regulator